MTLHPCYSTEELLFEDPLFRRVDLSILITMTNSSRREHYMSQLAEYRPTRKVLILHNQGFRSCEKSCVTNTMGDLWHANVQAAYLARGQPVLILEDDVEFLPAIRRHAATVETFFLSVKGPCLYNLGAVVHACVPSRNDHIRVLAGGMFHAVLYNAEALASLRACKIQNKVHDAIFTYKFPTYIFREPLAVQELDAHTENSKLWNVGGIPIFFKRNIMGMGCSRTSFCTYHRIAPYGGVMSVIILSVTLVTLKTCIYANSLLN